MLLSRTVWKTFRLNFSFFYRIYEGKATKKKFFLHHKLSFQREYSSKQLMMQKSIQDFHAANLTLSQKLNQFYQ